MTVLAVDKDPGLNGTGKILCDYMLPYFFITESQLSTHNSIKR